MPTSFKPPIRFFGDHPYVSSALSAVMLFASWYQPLLVFVALIPWLCLLQASDPRQAWRKGYLFGLLYSLTQLYWLAQLTLKWVGSPVLALVPWLLAAVLMAIYFGLMSMLTSVCLQRGWLFAVPLAWAGMEVFRSYVPVLAFPWGLLATPFVECPFVPGIARLGTIYLVSAWAMLPALLLFAKSRKTHLALLTSFFGLALLPVLLQQSPEGTWKRIMVAQPGVDVAFSDPQVAEQRLHAAVDRLITQADEAKADMIILPEGVERLADQWPPTLPYGRTGRTPVVVGAQRGTRPVYQSAISFDGTWSFADKTRLVIFGEFVPLRDQLPFLQAFNLPSGDISAGDRVMSLKVAGITVGPLVCFEALFPDLAWRQRQNGAQLLAVMSIDDWFMGSAAPDQLRAGSIWRSYETGLPLVRSASTGASLVTDSRGKVLAELPPKVEKGQIVRIQIPDRSGPEPGQLIFPALAVLSLIGLPVLFRLTSDRSHEEAQNPPDACPETDQSQAKI